MLLGRGKAGRLPRVIVAVVAVAALSGLAALAIPGGQLAAVLARARLLATSLGGAGAALSAPPGCRSGAACTEAPLPAGGVPYSHSWYVDGAVASAEGMAALGTADARWLVRQTAAGCAEDFLTVLDFGHPTRKAVGGASPLDDYAMSMFRPRAGGAAQAASYHEVEGLAEHYLDAWVAAANGGAGGCPRLRLALGTSNFAECRDAVGPCDVYAAGQYWDAAVHDVMDYVAAKGYGSRVTAIWVADDLETSWDPWPTTARYLQGVRDQEHTYAAHAHLINYGDANVGACSIVTGCRDRWSAANVYDAAWGIGWALPLPEAYNADTTSLWEGVAAAPGTHGAMAFAGVMTECAGADPLPAGPCRPQGGGVTGKGACEWSPTVAFNHLRAIDAGQSLAYATNIQWPDWPADKPPDPTPCG